MPGYQFSFSADVKAALDAGTDEFRRSFAALLDYLEDNPYPRELIYTVVPSKDDPPDAHCFFAFFDGANLAFDVTGDLIHLTSIQRRRPHVLPDLASPDE